LPSGIVQSVSSTSGKSLSGTKEIEMAFRRLWMLYGATHNRRHPTSSKRQLQPPTEWLTALSQTQAGLSRSGSALSKWLLIVESDATMRRQQPATGAIKCN